MFMYHEQHPYQYIGIVAIVFGLLGMMWFHYCGHSVGRRRWITILITIILVVLLSSIPGGILWKIHDMQAGYFTEGSIFWNDLCWGAVTGLSVGWLVILTSIPYNLIGLIIGGLLLDRLPNLIYHQKMPHK